ncbi:MAG: MMPL family transporter [Clostridiales bacterium]|nr:MMPL family transporter [Clostridiales bacterium]
MQKLYRWTVDHPMRIIVAFSMAFVMCALLVPMVSVNFDIHSYLPEKSPSSVSIDMMNEEYAGSIPNARVMVKNVTVPEALAYKDKLLKIDGVADVTWLDDAADIYVPFDALDSKIVKSWYADNAALFSVSVETESRIETVAAIRDMIGNDNAMAGTAVTMAGATTDTIKEIERIAVIAVIFALFVLVMATTSWIEPFVILCGLGVAIVINTGTNLMFGEVSFVTSAAGSILQLAVSLDYSVFLLHRFVECRGKNLNAKDAMVDALTKSSSSIVSSGLTTVIGFLALCLMRYGIGPDLGVALAKGIGISLLTVFLFFPSLIMVTIKLIDKTQHRRFTPSMRGFGKFVTKLMLPMACLFALVIVPSFLASFNNDFYYGASKIFGPATQLGQDAAAIEDVYGKNDTYVLMVPKGSTATEQALSQKLGALPQVNSIISFVDTVGAEIPLEYLDSDVLSKLVSKRYSRMVISVGADFDGEETFSLVKAVRRLAGDFYGEDFYLAGEGVSTYDLMDTVTSDMVKVNLVAVGAVFLVLLLMMRSLFLPALLVLGIETAIWINLSIPYFAGTPIFYVAYLIISAIQLGATVDYAILFTNRYNEYRCVLNRKPALVETVSAVTVSILTSGTGLTAVGMLLGKYSTHSLISQLGYFIGKGTLCSLAVVFFVLPGLLYCFDGIIRRYDYDFLKT